MKFYRVYFEDENESKIDKFIIVNKIHYLPSPDNLEKFCNRNECVQEYLGCKNGKIYFDRWEQADDDFAFKWFTTVDSRVYQALLPTLTRGLCKIEYAKWMGDMCDIAHQRRFGGQAS